MTPPGTRNARWVQRHPLRAKLLLSLGAVVVSLAGGEVVFRLLGHEPGWVPGFNGPFERVEVLVLEDSFRTDEHGIFRANPDHDWPGDTRVNASGFRSIPFQVDGSEQTSVLFLGDSFTWGASAQPLTRSFVDRVAEAGHVCFNGGIPGTDPEQYARVGERWIPSLRPDVVVVSIFMGNDIHCDLVDVPPGQALWYVTNAGWISGFSPDGAPLETAVEAYRLYEGLYNAVGHQDRGPVLGLLRSVLTTTAVGTQVWVTFAEPADATTTPPTETEKEARQQLKLQRALALRERLERIRAAATSCGARFVLLLIPVRPSAEDSTNRLAGNRLLFQGFDARAPEGLTEAEYHGDGGLHFNNKGHRKFADFVCEILQGD